MVLNTLLQDLIYEKFKIEEEDQMKNMMGPRKYKTKKAKNFIKIK
jgi:hypothetical protein